MSESNSTQIVRSQDRPSHDRAVVERMARVLCRADGYPDPDALIYPSEPCRTRHGYFVPDIAPVPAWSFYLLMAARAVDAQWAGQLCPPAEPR